jgi:hypothetical protein
MKSISSISPQCVAVVNVIDVGDLVVQPIGIPFGCDLDGFGAFWTIFLLHLVRSS